MLKGLAFLLLALLVGAVVGWQWLVERGQDRARIDQRLALLAPETAAPKRIAAPLTMPQMIAPLLARAQIDLTPRALGIFAGLVALAGLAALITAGPIAALAALLLPPIAFLGWARRRAHRRMEALTDALPYYIDAVRQKQAVGNSLSQALERSLAEAPDIVRACLAPLARRLELGTPPGEAMQQVADRLRVPEMSMLAAAIRTNVRYGGSITTMLANLAEILRERTRIKRDLKAAISEAKVSSRVLIAMPLIAMALLVSMNPAYVDFFLHDARGHRLAIIAVGLQAAGMLVMRRVMRLDF